ncbi:MAG: S41 family peptidase [Cyanobacteria bacterium RUI128]|nr:S41 family peptidase [Cyanobacteria bacterium RUI128]
MKRRELIFFILTAVVVYYLYQFIATSLVLRQPVVNSGDLVNRRHVSPQKLYDESWKVIKKDYIDSSYNSQDWKRWRGKYNGKLKTDEDARVAVETMVASLDDNYTRFLTQKEYTEQANSIDSHITGVGVNIMSKAGTTVIYSVIEGTPAEKAGLRAGDVVLSVDGKSASGLDISKVAEIIRGPENSCVTLKLKRGKYTLIRKIIRKKIEIKSVEASVKSNNIGYIKIKSFIGSNTASDFVSALKTVDKTKGLILDLRGNTGGLLTNAVIVANLFVNDGVIVSIVSKKGRKHDITAQMSMPVVKKPMVVLVDGASASASEILSGALKDNKKAVLVGTRTFGKGLVQQIVPLPNGTGINITIAKYLTPDGSDINKKGIEPDYKVEYTMKDFLKRNDTQLKKAEDVLLKLCETK